MVKTELGLCPIDELCYPKACAGIDHVDQPSTSAPSIENPF